VPRWGFFILLYDILFILSGKSDKKTSGNQDLFKFKITEGYTYWQNYGTAVILNRIFLKQTMSTAGASGDISPFFNSF
jgi:hypothetical protein